MKIGACYAVFTAMRSVMQIVVRSTQEIVVTLAVHIEIASVLFTVVFTLENYDNAVCDILQLCTKALHSLVQFLEKYVYDLLFSKNYMVTNFVNLQMDLK